jgi:hypothetical protein
MAQTSVASGGNAVLLAKGGPMPDTPTPWVGLAALAAMFLLPLLPDWLFEGPRTSKHWPHRHSCGACGAPWTDGHTCASAERKPDPPLLGELRRLDLPAELEPRPRLRIFR